MKTRILVSASAQPDSTDFQSCRKFDLKLTAKVSSDASLAELSDAEVYELIYPLAVKSMREALQVVAAKTRSELKRIVPHEPVLINLDGYSDGAADVGTPFNQNHQITGDMIVDAQTAVSPGESWLIGVPDLANLAAQNIVTGVLRGLGRKTVEIDPWMVNGTNGAKIYTEI
jgi:hypothetical protein